MPKTGGPTAQPIIKAKALKPEAQPNALTTPPAASKFKTSPPHPLTLHLLTLVTTINKAPQDLRA